MSTLLLSDIEDFLRETGMGEYRFGLLAARNGRLVERLRTPRANGRPARIWPETEVEVRAFMRSHRSKHPAAKPSEERAA
ncbi:hypothetical protein [Bosea sp. (in: a-proteobacteria)]|uniref:hypothetical protein n=1 Tax=Bosea sp. (in: a-proteobacteria) TaxID=1871050 RepID=UPI00260B1108|nr:hypothetical protein [Bosea sp. (in: a-proteobacteria)]MCO5092640.1 hypothetical protein [Bosea sp. (in: a-proteobacteria)]